MWSSVFKTNFGRGEAIRGEEGNSWRREKCLRREIWTFLNHFFSTKSFGRTAEFFFNLGKKFEALRPKELVRHWSEVKGLNVTLTYSKLGATAAKVISHGCFKVKRWEDKMWTAVGGATDRWLPLGPRWRAPVATMTAVSCVGLRKCGENRQNANF